ncbi:MAG: hypothetical protein WBD55_04325 [Dehalococcoidia bacterium]
MDASHETPLPSTPTGAQDTTTGPNLDSIATSWVLAVGAAFAAAVAILVVHAPVFNHYFFGDDFVPLADISSRSTWGYVRDAFLLRDATPNWRFLTSMFYLGAYKAFGLNALPFLAASVLVHIGTALLLFAFVRRITASVWPAFLSAAFFGLTAAHAPTVAQVTAFNNVLAAFFLVLSLLTLYEGLERNSLLLWGSASALAFLAAISANESVAIIAPVHGLLVLWKAPEGDAWWGDRRQWLRVALPAAPFALLAGASLLALGACQCTEAARSNVFEINGDTLSNVWIYLARLIYPVQMAVPGDLRAAHVLPGLATVALLAVMAVRGPALARISVVFVLLALVPYAPIAFRLAPRYVYLASVPFSIVFALAVWDAARYAARFAPAAPYAFAAGAVVVLGLYGWRTWDQNREIAVLSSDFEELVQGLEARYPTLPPGDTVYVLGGPLTNPLFQFEVLPAVGETIWHGVNIYAVPEDWTQFCRPDNELLIVRYDMGRFIPTDLPPGATVEACEPVELRP